MHAILDRRWCLTHPTQTIQIYGMGVFFTMLSGRQSLLATLARHYRDHGHPMPGALGRAYRLSALLEYRMADIYARLAERFADVAPAHALFTELAEEEREHGCLMDVCRHVVTMKPAIRFIPSLQQKPLRLLLASLRAIRNGIASLSLEEALNLTEELERGEINVLFGQLLAQVQRDETRPFAEALAAAEGHAWTVPRRIAEVRQLLLRQAA